MGKTKRKLMLLVVLLLLVCLNVFADTEESSLFKVVDDYQTSVVSSQALTRRGRTQNLVIKGSAILKFNPKWQAFFSELSTLNFRGRKAVSDLAFCYSPLLEGLASELEGQLVRQGGDYYPLNFIKGFGVVFTSAIFGPDGQAGVLGILRITDKGDFINTGNRLDEAGEEIRQVEVDFTGVEFPADWSGRFVECRGQETEAGVVQVSEIRLADADEDQERVSKILDLVRSVIADKP